MSQGGIALDIGSKRLCDHLVANERIGRQHGRCGVALVQQVVDLGAQAPTRAGCVFGAQVQDGIPGVVTGADVVEPIGMVLAVFVAARAAAAHGLQVHAKAPGSAGLVGQVQLEHLAGHQRDAVAGLNLDCAVQTWRARLGGRVAAVAAAAHGLVALVGGLQPIVVQAVLPLRIQRARQAQLQALAARLTKVAEIAKSALLAGHKEDVVFVDGAKHAGRPLVALGRFAPLAAHAHFEGARDHLPERRVAGHGVG